MSVLGIFDIARTALNVTRKALDTTAHNVANVSTPGYTRQDVILTNMPSGQVSSMGMSGRGVQLTEVKRLYDSFVSLQLKTESSNLSYWDIFEKGVVRIENIFNEATDNGLGPAVTDFFNAWQEVSQNPEGYAQRTLLVKKAEFLGNYINRAYISLDDERTEIYKNSQSLINEVNSITPQIMELNSQIASSPGALDLQDKRDELVRQLNDIIKVNTFEDSAGRYTVMLGGTPLVDGGKTFKMSVATDTNNEMGLFVEIKDPYGTIVEQRDVTSLASGGKILANLDLRDSKITDYMNKLNALSIDISNTINFYHMQGYGLDTSTGNNFFNSPLVSGSGLISDTNAAAGSGVLSSVNINTTVIDTFTIDGANKTILFNAGGGPWTATLTEGTYTADELAAELRRALEVADGDPDDIFTTTYDASTKKFTVENNTGNTNALNLLWTNAGTTAEQIFGFTADSNVLVGNSVSSDTQAATKSGDVFDYVYDEYRIVYSALNPAGEGEEDFTVTDVTTGRTVAAKLAVDTGGFGRTLEFNGLKIRIEGDLSGIETYEFQLNENYSREMVTSITDPKQVAASSGMFSVDSSNNIISFNINGGATLTAALATGTYTGEGLAAEVKKALEAANGNADTYTVVYNPGIKKFKIINESGANTINLLWTSSSSTTAESLLGFSADSGIGPGGYDFSDGAVSAYATSGIPGNNGNAKTIADLVNQAVVAGGGAMDFYRQLVSDVGVETQAAKLSLKFQETLVGELEKRRDELSGVSLDEEAANLLKYQKSFEAAAKMITIAEELLDTIMRMTGR